MTWKSDPKPKPKKKKGKVDYKRVYRKFFGYSNSEDEWIPSELSGARSGPPHHIYNKQMGGKKTFTHDGVEYDIDAIENLIGLTPDEHTIAHDDSHPEHKTKSEYWDLHQDKMKRHLNVSKSRMQ